jgi:hypothetical protein
MEESGRPGVRTVELRQSTDLRRARVSRLARDLVTGLSSSDQRNKHSGNGSEHLTCDERPGVLICNVVFSGRARSRAPRRTGNVEA